ncbi:MAG: Ppx/GppA phosphatase family protein [Filifactoraceae bacterium]
MKFASIDIGTNSMRLLITNFEKSFYDREKYVNITRMGSSVDSTGKLTDEAMNRNIESLKVFAKQARDASATEIYAMGTSALRDSINKEVFLERAKVEAGVDVEIIKGVEEANLGFMGVVAGISIEGYVLIVDIGGGSTEFVVGSEAKGIVYSKSINVGALRMTEKFIKNDPPLDNEIDKMREYIGALLKPEINIIKTFEISGVIGIGGTATTVSAISQELQAYDTNRVHNSKISKAKIKIILDMILRMNQDERINLAGLQPQRADIITSGIVILDEIVTRLAVDNITISEFDNLEGLIYKKIIEKSKS